MSDAGHGTASGREAAEGPPDPAWLSLPAGTGAGHALAPGRGWLVFAGLALLPVVVIGLYTLLPQALRSRWQDLSLSLFLLAAAGGAMFLVCLLGYRGQRQLKQLRLNEALVTGCPERFVLYLRSFRRTGAVVVRNHMPKLPDRRLLGVFWDIELALSFAVANKLPVVAVGAASSSLGAAKFLTDDGAWQKLVDDLAQRASAIVILPDDRPGTLWELRRVLTDRALRRKTLVVMPAEQHGWMRRLRRLPTIRASWERVRALLAPDVQLPAYDERGAFLFPGETADDWNAHPLMDFQVADVQEAVALAAAGRGHAARPLLRPVTSIEQDWIAMLDPVWALALFGATLLSWWYASSHPAGMDAYAAFAMAVSLATALVVLVNSAAFTSEVEATEHRSLLHPLVPTNWLGLAHLPPLARSAVNTLVMIAAISLFRAWAYEPFKVPSGSMLPTLKVGDLILVDKHRYGLNLPFTTIRLRDGVPVERADVIAFRPSHDPGNAWVKRVVGLPGDEVSYRGQRLSLNGQPVPTRPESRFFDEDALRYVPQAVETHGARQVTVAVDPERTSRIEPAQMRSFEHRESCRHDEDGLTCRVPAGHYFVMGDNRDNSLDSRYWGFVPADHVVGRVSLIWMNFGQPSRTGTTLH